MQPDGAALNEHMNYMLIVLQKERIQWKTAPLDSINVCKVHTWTDQVKKKSLLKAHTSKPENRRNINHRDRLQLHVFLHVHPFVF